MTLAWLWILGHVSRPCEGPALPELAGRGRGGLGPGWPWPTVAEGSAVAFPVWPWQRRGPATAPAEQATSLGFGWKLLRWLERARKPSA